MMIERTATIEIKKSKNQKKKKLGAYHNYYLIHFCAICSLVDFIDFPYLFSYRLKISKFTPATETKI